MLWQPALFGADEPRADPSFAGIERIELDATSWVDYLPGWLRGSDVIFETLVRTVEWEHLDRPMFGQMVRQPRLTARWHGSPGVPALGAMADYLSARYTVEFDSVGLNLYRHGGDSVAWHGDRIPRSIIDPIVALVSLGEPRRFLLRPKGGGRSIPFALGRGDLLVTGGSCQRSWQHSVPKLRSAGARISVAYRHSVNPGDDRAQTPTGAYGPPAGPDRAARPQPRRLPTKPEDSASSDERRCSWRSSDPDS
jgi:alkylated DNA repair dioxygenase AlkB